MTSFVGSIRADRPAIAGYPPGAALGPRLLRDFEFVWVLAGVAEWTWLDGGEQRELTPGLVLLTRPVVPPGPVGGLLDYLLWLSEDPHDSVIAHVERTIAALVPIFVGAPLPDGSSAREPPALAAVLDDVRGEWMRQVRPISLAELALAGAVSNEHVTRLFRRRYGVAPIAALELGAARPRGSASHPQQLQRHVDCAHLRLPRSSAFFPAIPPRVREVQR